MDNELDQLRAEVTQQKERNSIMKANMQMVEEELRAENEKYNDTTRN